MPKRKDPKPNDRRAKAFVRDYLAETCGVTLAELERRKGEKTADFEMLAGGERVLVAELKTLEHLRPSAARGWTMIRDEEDGYEAYKTGHNGPARIAEKVAGAFEQLSKYPRPRAVILHNTDFQIDVRDLFEFFEGERVIGKVEGRRIIMTNSRKVAFGKTYAIRKEIDLYVWVDQEDRPRRLG